MVVCGPGTCQQSPHALENSGNIQRASAAAVAKALFILDLVVTNTIAAGSHIDNIWRWDRALNGEGKATAVT